MHPFKEQSQNNIAAENLGNQLRNVRYALEWLTLVPPAELAVSGPDMLEKLAAILRTLELQADVLAGGIPQESKVLPANAPGSGIETFVATHTARRTEDRPDNVFCFGPSRR